MIQTWGLPRSVRFDGREYGVPFACVGRAVQIARLRAATVEISVEDRCVKRRHKGQIDQLATSEFVRRKEVVLLLGPSAVGKSHLAAKLGVKAVQIWVVCYFEILRLKMGTERPLFLAWGTGAVA